MKNLKKILVLVLSLMMVFALVACGSEKEEEKDEPVTAASIIANYPADINDWTADDFNKYFTEMGVYTNADYIYVQDHATYYHDTAVDTCGGYMDDTGDAFTGVFIIDADSTEADPQAVIDTLKDTHAFPEELGFLPVDHMVGNVAFFYSFSQSDDFYNAFDDAYNQLVSALNLTAEF